ncbi:RNA polymerase sigma factor [Fuerstiella marisgermanici]|uniref:RNA polymerase sigma factor n=1 Tax=Fuerstiella marisgermanici TaxID=1891926 RepID=UPI00097C32DC|nr:sigma-70 family RNA polymerase sigma factor [Fuerstiella marisgermanici]
MPVSPPETRASLILRLQDAADVVAWDEFTDVYAPVVYRSARRMGLQAADADDCAQEVLSSVARSVSKWLQRDNRGPFRAWLFRIARNTAIDFLTRRKHQPWAEGGDAAAAELGKIEAPPDVSSHFNLEYHREMFLRASEIVRQQVNETNWQAFYRTSVLLESVEEAGHQLGVSTGRVYLARSRVMKRLQQVVQTMEGSAHDKV